MHEGSSVGSAMRATQIAAMSRLAQTMAFFHAKAILLENNNSSLRRKQVIKKKVVHKDTHTQPQPRNYRNVTHEKQEFQFQFHFTTTTTS